MGSHFLWNGTRCNACRRCRASRGGNRGIALYTRMLVISRSAAVSAALLLRSPTWGLARQGGERVGSAGTQPARLARRHAQEWGRWGGGGARWVWPPGCLTVATPLPQQGGVQVAGGRQVSRRRGPLLMSVNSRLMIILPLSIHPSRCIIPLFLLSLSLSIIPLSNYTFSVIPPLNYLSFSYPSL